MAELWDALRAGQPTAAGYRRAGAERSELPALGPDPKGAGPQVAARPGVPELEYLGQLWLVLTGVSQHPELPHALEAAVNALVAPQELEAPPEVAGRPDAPA